MANLPIAKAEQPSDGALAQHDAHLRYTLPLGGFFVSLGHSA